MAEVNATVSITELHQLLTWKIGGGKRFKNLTCLFRINYNLFPVDEGKLFSLEECQLMNVDLGE